MCLSQLSPYNRVKTFFCLLFQKSPWQKVWVSDCVSACEMVMGNVLRLSLTYFSALICSVFSASEDGWMPQDTCAATHMRRELRSLTASLSSRWVGERWEWGKGSTKRTLKKGIQIKGGRGGGKTPLYLFNLICSLWNLLSWLWFIVNRWAAALFKNGC